MWNPTGVHLLVIGGSGCLGRSLAVQARHRVSATYLTAPLAIPGAEWHRLDIRQRREVHDLVVGLRPDVVVNAAYVQGDWASTADGAAHVVLAAAAVGARLVHVSSDALFSGAANPYAETALPDPATPYGAAKAAAETVVKAVLPTAVIARTSLIIGDEHSPFVARVHGLIGGALPGVLFTDDVRCPVDVTDLSLALLELAASAHAGVHHVAGPDALSRHELGLLIAARDGLDGSLLRTARRAGTGLPGPIDVRLDSALTRKRLTTRLRGAHEFLG
jgi:dTDP-4-dehydrorhamnose reductase